MIFLHSDTHLYLYDVVWHNCKLHKANFKPERKNANDFHISELKQKPVWSDDCKDDLLLPNNVSETEIDTARRS